jgi:glutaredoxin-like YruB-family protein
MSMGLLHVKSHEELTETLDKKKDVYLLLYKEGSDLSECAKKNIEKADQSLEEEKKDYLLLAANVKEVRDIHPNYGIKSVPMLLHFKNGKFTRTVAGCNNYEYYRNIFGDFALSVGGNGESKRTPRVTVYSTPSCPWCNKLKQYLRENNIPFRDIDVSRDTNAAQEMVRRTGQQGVPQAEINGQWVVGFDKPKIDRLLGLTVK